MIACEAGCYGKLPIHADFIRHNAGPEVLAFDGFLQQGILSAQKSLGDGWRAAYEQAGTREFIRLHPESKQVLCGVITPSQGKAGRAFPFMVSCRIALGKLRRPAILPLLCERFLSGARELVTRDWTGADLNGVRREVSALSGALDPKEAERRLEDLLTGTSFEGLLGESLGAWDERRFLFLLNAASLLGPRSRPRFVLVLPPAVDPAAVALWLELVARLRGEAGLFPRLVSWSTADPQGGVRCVLIEPGGEHYPPTFLPQLPSDACELYQEGLETASLLEKARARFGALSDRAGLTVGQLLKELR